MARSSRLAAFRRHLLAGAACGHALAAWPEPRRRLAYIDDDGGTLMPGMVKHVASMAEVRRRLGAAPHTTC